MASVLQTPMHIYHYNSDNPQYNTSDHRCLLGLVPISILPSSAQFTTLQRVYQLITKLTVPYISVIWKTYCSLTHNSDSLSESHQTRSNLYSSPRPTVISGNNGTLTTETITAHYHSTFVSSANKAVKTIPPITHNKQSHNIIN